MKSFKYIIPVFISIVFGIISCHEPIDITVPETQKKIVLNGFINPDSTVTINLSKSISILQTDNDIEFLKTATVKLYENDVFKENLQYDTNGYYRGTVYPQTGYVYSITAEYPRLETVDAETEILPKPIISSVNSQAEFYSEIQTWYNDETGESFDTTINTLNSLNVDVTLQDPENQTNWYFLTFSAIMPQYANYPPNFEPVFLGNKMTSLYYDTDNLNWENQYYSKNLIGYVFSDNLFNGSSYTINATVYGNGGYGGSPSIDTVYVNLHSITKDFYQYVISYSKYWDIEGNPLAEPVNIKSNIHNGFGFFSGYSTAKDTVIIDYDTAQ